MLKSVSAASAHRHMAAVKSATGSDDRTASGFGDLLDAAGEASQPALSHQATRGQSAGTSRGAGVPAAGANAVASTSTLNTGVPAPLPEPATDTEAGGLAAHVVGRLKKDGTAEESDTSPPAKTASDDQPSAPAKTGSTATPSIAPDALAVLAMQPPMDAPISLDDKAVAATAETQQSPAASGPDNATAKPGLPATAALNIVATAQSPLPKGTAAPVSASTAATATEAQSAADIRDAHCLFPSDIVRRKDRRISGHFAGIGRRLANPVHPGRYDPA